MTTEPMSPATIRRLMDAPTVEPDPRNHRIAHEALLRLARLRGYETGRALARALRPDLDGLAR